MDVSLDMASVPLLDKIKFYRWMGDMICSELSLNSIKISKAEKLMDKVVTKLKQERDNSRDLHLQNQNFKE